MPAPTPLRPSSFRSRVSRSLASRNVLRGRGAPAPSAIGPDDDTVEVTPLSLLEDQTVAIVSRAAVMKLAGLAPASPPDTDAPPGADVRAGRGLDAGAGGWTIERVLAERAVEPLFQPIVELSSLRPVGVEALARGPVGSGLWRARDLFAAAVAAGRLAELDTLCAERALEQARAAGSPPPLVFVNAEPAVIDQPLSARLRELMADSPFRIVLEYTERALSAHPAGLLQLAAAVQAKGHCLALDDVGADPMSLAFLPLLEPEVVKLDLQLVRAPHAPRTVEVVAAVNAVAERTGALIVAEGIETLEDLANARALGAHWGQGLYFGGPGPLSDVAPFVAGSGRSARPEGGTGSLPEVAPLGAGSGRSAWPEGGPGSLSGGASFGVVAGPHALRESRPDVHLPVGTPFAAAEARGKVRAANPEAFAAHLEHVVRRAGSGAVVLASCTDAVTARSWLPSLTGLADRAAFVGLVAPLHPAAVGPGVRFAQGPGAAVEECAFVVVAPRYTAAVCGRGSHRAMEFAHTEDGALVAAMARMILQRLPR
ncbi:EAL domain-containing protein [Dactylosporangium sp. CS-047395]|uniref:EAL domain-containing protein n=1 Tax=Dactylosporangium sp. CS-047395 TaxID=3239936 RepID=UPI003D89D359